MYLHPLNRSDKIGKNPNKIHAYLDFPRFKTFLCTVDIVQCNVGVTNATASTSHSGSLNRARRLDRRELMPVTYPSAYYGRTGT